MPPKTVEFCDGPNCGWQRPVTEVVVEGKRKRLCDECLKLVAGAKKTVADVVGELLGPPGTGASLAIEKPPSASRALLVGFALGILSGVAATLLVVRTP